MKIRIDQRHAANLRSCLLVALLLALTLPFGLEAGSEPGQIAGLVLGPARAPVGEATIVVSDMATKSEQTIRSALNGSFLILKLAAGSYGLTAKADGFVDFKQNVVIAVGSRVHLDIHLERSSEIRRKNK